MVEIVAEISGNHGGSLNKAVDMILAAADCDCDYAKFQFYRPEDMPDDNELYRKLMVPDEWLPDLFEAAHYATIGLFASVFSVRAAKTMLKFDIPYIKIASPDSTRLPWGTYRDIVTACSEAPDVELIVSTGKADAAEAWRLSSLMMYCPLGHPPEISWDDLEHWRSLDYAAFSDHTPGIRVPLTFIRYGAKMIEKHFKIDDDCVDAAFSASPETMGLLCRFAHQ